MLRRSTFLLVALAVCAPPAVRAGVVNPDISVIGQPLSRWSDDSADLSSQRVTLDPGETELVFDAYLNPYARGTFTLALGDEGLELEEGFFALSRGLPAGLAIKGGKYRAGFGQLNIVHPHAYPFAERFRVLASYLPGEESLNETGVQLSEFLPLPGDVALTVAVDWFQGDSYRVEREVSGAASDPLLADPENGDLQGEPRPAVLGRISAFVPLGSEGSALELGVSGTQGTNNAAAATRTTVFGADVKAKLWHGPQAYLLLQGEVVRLEREEAGWDEPAAAYTSTRLKPVGAYVFADYNFSRRYNVGASFESSEQPTADKTSDNAFGVYAGLALLEETTAFRIGWERFQPGRPPGATEDPEAVNTVTLRVIYSMGPHKAHPF